MVLCLACVFLLVTVPPALCKAAASIKRSTSSGFESSCKSRGVNVTINGKERHSHGDEKVNAKMSVSRSDHFGSSGSLDSHLFKIGWKDWFFARVEPPFLQKMHRSACAVFERVSCLKCQKNKNRTKPNHQQNSKTTKKQRREQETLECTCQVKPM